MLHNQLAQLRMQLGDRARASEHARAALSVMQRLGASDDEVQLRALLGLCALADGRIDDAERELDRIDQLDEREAIFGGAAVRQIGRAELALARGDVATGLRIYRECAARMRELGFPGIPRTGLEPWALFGDSTALTAHAYLATGDDVAHGRELFRRTAASTASRSSTERTCTSITRSPGRCCSRWGRGVCCAGRRRSTTPCGCSRSPTGSPTTARSRRWRGIGLPRAPRRLPPAGSRELQAEYDDSRPPDLLEEARRVVERLAS